jgi:hypothetical protein
MTLHRDAATAEGPRGGTSGSAMWIVRIGEVVAQLRQLVPDAT